MLLTQWLMHALDMFRLMAPYLLFGFLIAGALHVLVPKSWVARHLGGGGLPASVRAALIGTPLPLCSCGVVPFAELLKKQGASKPAITSFLISTPQTGVDSILAAYAILGLPLALWKVMTAAVSGVIGGTVASWVDRTPRAEAVAGPVADGGRSVSAALRYGLGNLLDDVAFWLLVGVMVGGAIAAFVPDGFLSREFLHPSLQIIAVLAVAVPLYVCATGSVPVAAALVLKGMPLGAAVVFLIAGPATNVATLAVFGKVLGKRILAVYLGSIVIVSVVFGLLFQVIFPHAHLAPSLQGAHVHSEPLAEVTWWEWASVMVLGGLMVRVFLRRLVRRFGRTRGSAPAAARGETMRLQVAGMSCAHCRRSVEKALAAIAGVTGVEVSLERAEARVTGEALNADALIDAVRRRGFTASRRP